MLLNPLYIRVNTEGLFGDIHGTYLMVLEVIKVTPVSTLQPFFLKKSVIFTLSHQNFMKL